ncbi:unnamed protein product [Durusdinium trenchii]|uniref:Peptidyl-prolyl cis-trans isomerase ESS1 (PPIase ESS1) (Parvulin ESS1) (Processing/termination factor 1) n=2 Tax=Durusdinium trenchii TaxID=1381693 RepID=A0ABP0RFV5_9DINO
MSTREGGGAWRTYTSKQVLGAKGASQLVGMFKNPDPPGAKEKEVREAEEKEAHARHFAGLLWTVIGVPPPDFTVVADSIGPSHRACLSIYTQPQPHPLKEVRVLGPRRSTPEEARKDGCDLKRVAFKCAEKNFNLQEVWRKCYQLENKQWSLQELAGEDVQESAENLLPEVQAAPRTKKDHCETTAEWFQVNNRRRDYTENFSPIGPSWALAQLQTPVPKLPGVWYMHERQNQEGKHVPFLFFNAESGRYYRNRSSDVAYVPAKSRWLQTGFPHQAEDHSMKMSHGSVCLPTPSSRKDDLAVILPELARTGSLLKQPLPFADKPAALFLLVDGLRNSSASEWCAKRFHTHLLPRLSALHSDPDDGELVSVVKEALTHLDHALLESPARYAGCSIAVALLMGTRLVVCTLGGCRATICTPSSEPVGPVAKKRTGAELPKWSCRPVEGTLPGHTRIDILQSQRRRRVEAYGPLDFDGRPGEQLRACGPSEAALSNLPERDRAVQRALRAAHPFSALGLSRAEALAAGPGAGQKAVEAIETLLAPRRGEHQVEAARSRVQAAGEAVDKMLTQDAFGAQQLVELFYVLDEEEGIISQQRAAALLAVPPGCGEAVASGAVHVRYQAVLSGLAATCPADATRGWDILREAIDAAGRPSTPIWTPPAESRGVEVSAAMGLRDLKRPRRLIGMEMACDVFRIDPGNTLCLLLLTDGANAVKTTEMATAVAANQGRPKALATQLAAVASEAMQGAKDEEPKDVSVGILAAYFSVKAVEDPPVETEADSKKRKAPSAEVVVGPQPGGGLPNRIRVSHILMKWESLSSHDPMARRAAPKGRLQADAEKELLKLLQILNEMPQNTPDAAKKLSAKFAELAKAHSDCNSANNGALADLGWIVPGQSDKDFEAAAFDLAVGAISDIVISQRGAHLVHRLA